MSCPFAKFIELYRTTSGVVSQCNNQNCYWLKFGGHTTAFRVSDFLAFKKELDAIDLEAMLADPSPGADYVILMPLRNPHCFVLDVMDILSLRELLDGAKFMIELNSLIKSHALDFSLPEAQFA